MQEENEKPLIHGKRGERRTQQQKDSDFLFCSEMFLRSYGYREIAKALNERNKALGLDYTIAHTQVYSDIKKMLITWKKEQFETIDKYVSVEVQKLDRIENEAWNAWEKSKSPLRKTKSRNSKKPNKLDAEVNEPDYYGYSEETIEETSGDPRFLDILLNCQQRRAKLLGFDAPSRVDYTDKNQPIDTDKPKYDIADVPADLLFNLADQMQNAEFIRTMDKKGLVN